MRLGAGPELLLEGKAHCVAEGLAARDRFGLEALLVAEDEQIDVSVVDGWSETTSAIPSGATEIELLPNSRQLPTGLTQHRVSEPGSPRHGGGGAGPVLAGRAEGLRCAAPRAGPSSIWS